jgi:O-acetyl-ADP-ribose deacetylase (regulator of RNase III)
VSIEIRTGDIFESGAEMLVNPVNCVGVMGKGLAAEFKKRFPDAFKPYKAACSAGEVQPGKLMVVQRPVRQNATPGPEYVVHFPTKNHWRQPSQYRYVKSGLEQLKELVASVQPRCVALPALGCGLGGLEWTRVRAMIEEVLGESDTEFLVYEPS